jgi:hypothetical protein
VRAVFSVDIPKTTSGQYPTDVEITKMVRGFGWEPVELRAAALFGEEAVSDDRLEAAKLAKYKELARPLFDQMLEIAAAEKDDVVFLGKVADDQTQFVVTRPVENQITFRLLHPVLPRLQASAKKIIKTVLKTNLAGRPLAIGNNRIVVYERGHDNIIIAGRVVSRPIRETCRTDLKDLLLTVVPVLILIPVTALLLQTPTTSTAQPVGVMSAPLMRGTLERFSTALFTTALVSLLGLLTTYYDIKKNRAIAWDVARDRVTGHAYCPRSGQFFSH